MRNKPQKASRRSNGYPSPRVAPVSRGVDLHGVFDAIIAEANQLALSRWLYLSKWRQRSELRVSELPHVMVYFFIKIVIDDLERVQLRSFSASFVDELLANESLDLLAELLGPHEVLGAVWCCHGDWKCYVKAYDTNGNPVDDYQLMDLLPRCYELEDSVDEIREQNRAVLLEVPESLLWLVSETEECVPGSFTVYAYIHAFSSDVAHYQYLHAVRLDYADGKLIFDVEAELDRLGDSELSPFNEGYDTYELVELGAPFPQMRGRQRPQQLLGVHTRSN